MNLDIPTPRWAIPLLQPSRYKGVYGGRASGKSHFMCERVVEHHVADKDFATVCIREVQKSLKFSAKRLIESKIEALGVGHMFKVQESEIKRRGGTGVMIFQGMQDHTADSIKSLEGFDLALCEEAQSLSQRSIDLLLPTIRKEDSEIHFIWNPDQETDPVDVLLRGPVPMDDAIVVGVNYTDNPFLPGVSLKEAQNWKKRDPDGFMHVWLAHYNTKADDQILAGCWRIDQFTPGEDWDGPYFGADWGFATDPNTLIECWIYKNKLYVYREQYKHGVEIDDTPEFFNKNPKAKTHTIRADCARPELISYVKRNGYPKIEPCKKWDGSVKDGISKLRSFDEIVIHEDCEHTAEEAKMWKYKRDRLTKDVLPEVIDLHNHCWDAVRYAIGPLIKDVRERRVLVIR